MKLAIPNYVEKIMDEINKNNYECYLVGGCVRDALLNKEPNDYDIATNCDTSTLKKIFKNYELINNNGEKHNTLTIHYLNHNIEVTSYKYKDDEYNTIEYDLLHRDITINSLAYKDGLLLDPNNGYADLKNKIIRAVNNPYDRFKEDPLRILRVLRFSSTLDFDIETNTSKAILELKSLLVNVSKERIRTELEGILSGSRIKHILSKYKDIIFEIIPELEICNNYDQKNKFHKNYLYDHIVNVCNNTKNDKILRIAALLHDIGKPHCTSIDNKGQAHYYNHTSISKQMSDVILKRLKYSNEDITQIGYLIQNHDLTLVMNKKCIRKNFANTPNLDENLFFKLIELMNADKQDHVESNLIDLYQIKELIGKIKEDNDCIKLSDLNINGNDLLVLGYKGKEIGENLNFLLQSVIEEKVKNNKSELINFLLNTIDKNNNKT